MADDQLRQNEMKMGKKIVEAPIQQVPKDVKVEKKKDEDKTKKLQEETEVKEDKKVVEEKKEDKKEEKVDTKKDEKKKVPVPKVKKEFAMVYGRSLPISLKYSKAIGRFIKGKKIEDAIVDLEDVMKQKIAVPMKGELAHRKGKGIMSGKYPIKASQNFIKLLKSLNSNSSSNGIDEPVISEVIANKAPERLHRFGAMKFKTTHVMIKAREGKK